MMRRNAVIASPGGLAPYSSRREAPHGESRIWSPYTELGALKCLSQAYRQILKKLVDVCLLGVPRELLQNF